MRSALPTFNEVWQQQLRAGVLGQVQHYPAETQFLIGCSGGMDSMLLLHLMLVLVPQRIRVIYVNHQLQAPSTQWGEFVQRICQSYNVPCVVQAVDVTAGNLEQQAREARYSAYQQHCQVNEVLVLAHHEQDQAETLLLRLLSGAGVQGLAAMKIHDTRENLRLWRPLLNISRTQIETWTKQLQLEWIEDPTNQDTHYDRAWCRQQLWPILESRFPKMQKSIGRTAQLMQDTVEILDEVLCVDWEQCIQHNALDIQKWRELSKPRQRQLISSWMKGEGMYRPALHMVDRLVNEVIDARVDAQAVLHCQDYYYVRYQQRIYRLSVDEYHPTSPQASSVFQLEPEKELVVNPCSYRWVQAAWGLDASLIGKILNLQTRQGGEKIHLHGRVGHWPLKKAIQAAQIFPWQRQMIQILSIDDVMLGVFTPQGFWLAQSEYTCKDGWFPQVIL